MINFAALVEQVPVSIIVSDREGRIVAWNRASQELFGFAAGEVMGQSLDVIIPERLRRAHWEAAAAGDADIVLATRLGVFAPLPRLALIVVDEEHDDSFRQQDGVRYHARDLAIWRAQRRNDAPGRPSARIWCASS